MKQKIKEIIRIEDEFMVAGLKMQTARVLLEDGTEEIRTMPSMLDWWENE